MDALKLEKLLLQLLKLLWINKNFPSMPPPLERASLGGAGYPGFTATGQFCAEAPMSPVWDRPALSQRGASGTRLSLPPDPGTWSSSPVWELKAVGNTQ